MDRIIKVYLSERDDPFSSGSSYFALVRQCDNRTEASDFPTREDAIKWANETRLNGDRYKVVKDTSYRYPSPYKSLGLGRARPGNRTR